MNDWWQFKLLNGEWIVRIGRWMPQAAKSCWSFPTSQTGQEPTEVGFSWNLSRNLPRQSAMTIDVTTSKRIRCFFWSWNHGFTFPTGMMLQYIFAFLPLHKCYNFHYNPFSVFSYMFAFLSYMFAFLPLHKWIVMDLPQNANLCWFVQWIYLPTDHESTSRLWSTSWQVDSLGNL